MGILADFVVLPAADAPRYRHGLNVPRENVGIWKGITNLELSTLWAILRSEPWADAAIDAFVDVSEADSDDEWCFRFPRDFVERLAALRGAPFESALKAWCATDEIGTDHVEGMRELFADLVRLAQKANDTGRSLFLWGCT